MSEEDAGPGSPVRFPWPPEPGESGIDALSRTWQMSLFRPSQFFAALPLENPVKPAILYALIMTLAGLAVSTFWAYVLPLSDTATSMDAASANPSELLKHPLDLFILATRPSVPDLLMSPLYTLLGLMLGAAIVHVLVMIFMRDRGPFTRTLCVTCYTHGAAIFAIVPVAGIVIIMVWRAIVTVVGLREAHRSTTGRAVAVVLVPVGCLLILGMLLVAVAMTMKGVLTP